MKTNIPAVHFITISADRARQRIDNFLSNHLKGIPKSMVYRILRKGKVRVNKKRIKPEYKLKAGDEIRIPPVRVSDRTEKNISPKLTKIAFLEETIIYEDDYILIMNKRSGIAVHGGSGLSFGVIEGLRILRPDANFLELVHRLDRDTSGILLIAKKRSALRSLHSQLREKAIQKDYLALVHGEWPSDIKVVREPLLKKIMHSGKRMVAVSSEGKPSATLFKVEERYRIATLVKASPVTGLTHQIRVHALHAGHPIVFDNRYGKAKFDMQLKNVGLKRLFLHAVALRFIHPNTKKITRVNVPLDEHLKHCLENLRQQHPYT